MKLNTAVLNFIYFHFFSKMWFENGEMRVAVEYGEKRTTGCTRGAFVPRNTPPTQLRWRHYRENGEPHLT